MTPASLGLRSETWAWFEGNFVFHLFLSSVLKNLALFKNNAEKLKQNKAHGFGICCLFSVAVRPHVLAMFLYVVCVFVCLFVCVL